ncbi:MAG: pectate lyase [Bacteroidales bacterium]|nr:pectate lyase [Bacteroidales bacterium]
MKRTRLFVSAVAALVLAACGGSGDGPDPVAKLDVPVGVTVTSVTTHSAIVKWDAVSGAENYEWKVLDGSKEVVTGTTRNTNALPDGLTKAHDYSFAVQAKAGDAVSGYSAGVSFRTAGEPDNPGKEDPEEPDDPGTEPDEPVSEAVYAEFGIPSVEEDGTARAFPGAEGGGMYTTGGRGGKVIHVTNLNDSGEGSLRAALTASGKRTVVFDVAGIIALNSAIQVKNGDLTIAGQTAPGDGICIKNYTLNISASNVIIRYLHFRLGDEGPNAGDGEDCIWGRYQKDIILDHCSMSWSIDECASFYANENFTLQWCILTESMNNSAHSKGAHGYGGIWGGKNASFHHTLLANHHSRNPRIDHPQIYPGSGLDRDLTKRGNVDLRNLVIYNWGDNSSYGGEGGWFNFVNCYYKPGPDSKDRKYFVDAYKNYTVNGSVVDYGYPSLYLSGNVHTKYSDITGNNANGIYWHNGGSKALLGTLQKISGPSGESVCNTTHAAVEGMEAVLAYAGDNIHRDAVDTRAVDGVKNNTGKIIDTPADVGGWPEYGASDAQISALKDSDGDGMPDAFEDKFGLDKADAADGAKVWLDRNGRYTNLEMYLHYLVREVVSAQNAGGEYVRM